MCPTGKDPSSGRRRGTTVKGSPVRTPEGGKGCTSKE